jgi:hypothetical protein
MSTGKHATFTQFETLYDPEFCAKETVDGIQQQQWHCHRRNRKRTAYRHMGIFHNTPANVSINSHNGQLTLQRESVF